MNAILVRAALLGLLVSTAAAKDFYLKNDATGEVYGPYQVEDGAKITIGTTVCSLCRT